MKINCYTSGHMHSQLIARAFAEGGNFPLIHDLRHLLPGPMFTYGNLRGLKPLLDQAIAEGRDWYYGDNGYFLPGHYAGYYRVTKNGYQHDGKGDAPPDRWRQLHLYIEKWQIGGRQIIVCPPGNVMAELRGFDAKHWLIDTLKILEANTDRPIRVRMKPKPGSEEKPLAEDLQGAHALVCHSSNAAVSALIAGVPVFCTDPCASSIMGLSDVSKIETPFYPGDRFRWACVLAANQWTLNEFRDGTLKKDMGL